MHVHEEMRRDLVIIPIDGSKMMEAVYSTHDGVTVINITKPEQAECFICEICSVSLNSLTRLEKHKEEKRGRYKGLRTRASFNTFNAKKFRSIVKHKEKRKRVNYFVC